MIVQVPDDWDDKVARKYGKMGCFKMRDYIRKHGIPGLFIDMEDNQARILLEVEDDKWKDVAPLIPDGRELAARTLKGLPGKMRKKTCGFPTKELIETLVEALTKATPADIQSLPDW